MAMLPCPVVAQQGGDMEANTPAVFAAFILAERKHYASIVAIPA